MLATQRCDYQMSIGERVARYAAIEDSRERPLIVYATSTRLGVNSQIAGDAVRELIDQIDAIPSEESKVDVLIHSTGGDALAAWKLMSILRERFDAVAVLVPYMAFSAATLFCLGADEIVMHPHASLGPIDPQITIPQGGGQQRAFSFEDVGAFLRFLKEEIGLSEQVHATPIVEKLLSVVDAVHVGGAKRASELSTDVGERLLKMHMAPDEQARAREIAEGLNKSFFAHGDAVSRTRARDLQLKVADNDQELERLIWDAYLGIESHMEFRAPFVPLEHFIDTAGQDALTPTAPLVLPPNAPEQVVQQIWNQVANRAVQRLTADQPVEVPYELLPAIIESRRRASVFRTRGTMTAVRMTGGEVHLNMTQTQACWVPVDLDGGDDNNQGTQS